MRCPQKDGVQFSEGFPGWVARSCHTPNLSTAAKNVSLHQIASSLACLPGQLKMRLAEHSSQFLASECLASEPAGRLHTSCLVALPSWGNPSTEPCRQHWAPPKRARCHPWIHTATHHLETSWSWMMGCLKSVFAEHQPLPVWCGKMQVMKQQLLPVHSSKMHSRPLMKGLERPLMQGPPGSSWLRLRPLLVHGPKMQQRLLMQRLEAKLHLPQRNPVLTSCRDAQRCKQQMAVDAKLSKGIP